MTDESVIATDGRVIGERAARTRARLLEATAESLRTQGALEVKVADVVRIVGTSPATFYQYFSDVEDAIYALATDLVPAVAPISNQLAEAWNADDALEKARLFVNNYINFWDRYGSVLRLMLLRADERDERFRQVRRDYNAPFMTNMSNKVRDGIADGRLPADLDAQTVAGAMLAALDRLPNYREVFEKRGTTRQAMTETMARLLVTSLTGYQPR